MDHPVIRGVYGEIRYRPGTPVDGSCKLGCATLGSADDLIAILGEPNAIEDAEKVAYSWAGVLDLDGKRWAVALWDWKGSSEHGQWSLWSAGGKFELQVWLSYLRNCLDLRCADQMETQKRSIEDAMERLRPDTH